MEYLVTLRLPDEGFTCPAQTIRFGSHTGSFGSTSLTSGKGIDPLKVLREPRFVTPRSRLRR